MKQETGFGTAGWMAGLALVVLPLVMIVLGLPRWFDRAEVATALAHDIARTVIRSPDIESGITAASILVNEFLAETDLVSGPKCRRSCVSFRVTGDVARGESVTATVTVEMPGFVVPPFGTVGATSWSAVHTERVDDFRSLP